MSPMSEIPLLGLDGHVVSREESMERLGRRAVEAELRPANLDHRSRVQDDQTGVGDVRVASARKRE